MKKKSAILILASMLAAPMGALAADVDEKTKDRVREAIEAYVRDDLDLKGKFLILDPRSSEPLTLDYDHLHSGVYPHEMGYRACADFTDAAGTVYDVDVVVGVGEGAAEVRQVFLHKAGGEPVSGSTKQR